MIDRQAALKRFASAEDKTLCGRAVDLALSCALRGGRGFTDFLDPARAETLTDIFSRERDIKTAAFGGYEGAERVMLGFCGEYDDIGDFPIAQARVSFDPKFAKTVRHQDFLGAILGLGIDRAKIGDIVIKQREAAVFAEAGIAAFIAASLTKVGREPVECALADSAEDVFAPMPVEETRLSVQSARADAIAAAAFRLPRSETRELADKGRLFLNWSEAAASKTAEAGDVITLRGHGRFKILEMNVTKKDRLSVLISRS